MGTIPFFWVDAFTDKPFGGNPAAVCPLDSWLPDEELQQMAHQHGLSETAYFVPQEDGGFHLRWFTPANEVDLCGHATLAAAHILYTELGYEADLRFQTQSGELTVSRDRVGRLELNFPSRPPIPLENDLQREEILNALGVSNANWVGRARDHFIVLPDEASVRSIEPNFALLAQVDAFAFIVTAPGDKCDFVSRFFAPQAGIDEDPVTGSAHCTLTPFWAQRLDQKSLHARQISARGGELWCTLDDDRVRIAGHAVTYLKGQIFL